MTIALIDHGSGNLRSVQKAFEAVGAQVVLTSIPDEILAADKVVLPGVGAFADAMNGLSSRGLTGIVKQVVRQKTPLLGICVGMQMLFEASEEHGEHAGLGMLRGRVKLFPDQLSQSESDEVIFQKIPQTGWNQVRIERATPLLAGLPAGSYAYFNHSFYCEPSVPGDILGSTEYGIQYASVVGCENLYGVQFHPEKSQDVGLAILKNFVEKC